MKSTVIFVLFCLGVQMVAAQTSSPDSNNVVSPTGQAENPEMLDASGLVINKNDFSYDGAEGRDPFKIYREYVQPTQNNGAESAANTIPANVEKNIRTATVPEDVIVQGIFYKKDDPIALVVVKGVKGLNKLKINSPIGRNEGKIIDIRRDRVIIEQVREFDGQKFSEKIELKVREKRN